MLPYLFVVTLWRKITTKLVVALKAASGEGPSYCNGLALVPYRFVETLWKGVTTRILVALRGFDRWIALKAPLRPLAASRQPKNVDYIAYGCGSCSAVKVHVYGKHGVDGSTMQLEHAADCAKANSSLAGLFGKRLSVVQSQRGVEQYFDKDSCTRYEVRWTL